MADIHPEAVEAIRIADKHLAGKPAELRNALAMDIIQAINRCATDIAADCISEGLAKTKAAAR